MSAPYVPLVSARIDRRARTDESESLRTPGNRRNFRGSPPESSRIPPELSRSFSHGIESSLIAMSSSPDLPNGGPHLTHDGEASSAPAYFPHDQGLTGMREIAKPLLQPVETAPRDLVIDSKPHVHGEKKLTVHRKTSSDAFAESSLDFVQFAGKVFYCDEGTGFAEVFVIRDGTLAGACSVHFHTEDLSAIAGDKYTEMSGVLEFGPGVCLQKIVVSIMSDENFDTSLEFKVILGQPSKCVIKPQMRVCTVLIIDDDLFPSNELEEAIKDESGDVLRSQGVSFLFDYMFFVFRRVPTMWWKSLLLVVLGQLQNAYYLMTIYIRVYLVDTALNMKQEDEERVQRELLVANSRWMTVVVLALLWVMPNMFLCFVDFLEVGPLDVGFAIRKHHRVNLFRKYLTYTQKSVDAVPVHDLVGAVTGDIPDMAEKGYLVIFKLLKGLGKIVCVAVFMLRKNPSSALPLLVYPTVMYFFIKMRHKKSLDLMDQAGAGQSEATGMLVNAVQNGGLLADYKQQSSVVEDFEQQLLGQRNLNLEASKFSWWNEQLVPWLTLIAIGSYMVLGGGQVILGVSTIGSYLATINVYKDLGDRFDGVYSNVRSFLEATDPLVTLTLLLNMDTNVEEKRDRNQIRIDFMNRALNGVKSKLSDGGTGEAAPSREHQGDEVPDLHMRIVFDGINVGCVKALQNIKAEVLPGTLVMIQGGHGTGKATMVDILTDNADITGGQLLVSPHQSVLHVSHAPRLLTYKTMYENLVFGATNPDPARVRTICKRVKLSSLCLLLLDKEIAEFAQVEDDSASHNEEELEDNGGEWHSYCTLNDKKRLHLARALVYDPDVLVLHRPVDETDLDVFIGLLSIFREFVDQRGLEHDPQTLHRRSLRTLFFTTGILPQAELSEWYSDEMWTLSKETGLEVVAGCGGRGERPLMQVKKRKALPQSLYASSP